MIYCIISTSTSDGGVSASLSSTYQCIKDSCFPAHKAIDGIYIPETVGASNDWESIAHTLKTSSPYIQLDLGRSRCVKGVKIWNRSNDGNYGMWLNKKKQLRK